MISIKTKFIVVMVMLSILTFLSLSVPFIVLYENYYINGQIDEMESIYSDFNVNEKNLNTFFYSIYLLENQKAVRFIIFNEEQMLYSTNKLIGAEFDYDKIYSNDKQIDPLITNGPGRYKISKGKDFMSNVEVVQLFSKVYINENEYSMIIEKVIPNLVSLIKNVIVFMFTWMIPISAMFAILIGIIIDFMLNPIIEINNKSKKIANLEFGENITNITNDEIGELAKSINTMSKTLENKIIEIESTNEKLKTLLEKEELSLAAQKEFISNVSHELKTPITLISGYAEAVILNIDEDSKKEYLEIIKKESIKMNHIILELLEIAKLQSGNSPLKVEKFNLKDLTEEVLNKYAILINEKNITLELDVSDVEIEADKGKLEIVINNYIINSIKHVDKNKYVKISVIEDNGTTIFKVFNTSPAISEIDANNIWSNFYKIEKSHSREDGGTGIGLYISKNILEIHNFEYGFLNENYGVTFFFKTKRTP